MLSPACSPFVGLRCAMRIHEHTAWCLLLSCRLLDAIEGSCVAACCWVACVCLMHDIDLASVALVSWFVTVRALLRVPGAFRPA